MMLITRRRAVLAATLASLRLGFAQAFPVPGKPVRILVPFPAGGSTDVTARELAQRLTRLLGTPCIVENKAGASTLIAAQEVRRAVPDGHTLLYTSLITHALNPHLMKAAPYDAQKDFAPVTGTTRTSLVLVAHAGVPARNVAEFIEYARSNPGRASYASVGTGSTGHILGAHLSRTAGVEMTHVPYRGTAPASQDLMGGQVDSFFDPAPTALQKIATGKVKPLAVAGLERLRQLPDVPTLKEHGYIDFDADIWNGLFAPAGLLESTAKVISDGVARVSSDGDFQAFIARGAELPMPHGPENFRAFVRRSNEEWGRVISRLNIKLQE